MHRRVLLSTVALLAVAAAGAEPARPGGAQPFVGGITMTSDPGDWVGQGQSYSFPARAADVRTWDSGVVELRVRDERSWTLSFAAPGGERLEVGEYRNAHQTADAVYPGLSVSGAGHGCSKVDGSFTVHDVAYGASGDLLRLHTDFVQYCDGSEPALRGEVDIAYAAAPRPLPPPVDEGDRATAAGAASETGGVPRRALWVALAVAVVLPWALLAAAWARGRRRSAAEAGRT